VPGRKTPGATTVVLVQIRLCRPKRENQKRVDMVENVGVKIRVVEKSVSSCGEIGLELWRNRSRVVEKSASSAGESESEVATSWLVLIG
jgi:hypothetical protein